MSNTKGCIDTLLSQAIQRNPSLINFSKWGKYLPVKYQVSLIRQKLYDFDAAFEFIRTIKLIHCI